MSNNYDSLQAIIELQESIRKINVPLSALHEYQEQLDLIREALKSPMAEYIRQTHSTLSAIQKNYHPIDPPHFGVVNEGITEFLSQVQNSFQMNFGSETLRSLNGAKTAINELASYIQGITLINKDVYIPAQLIPEDYVYSEEADISKNETPNPQPECSNKKKVSLRDAYDIIYGLIMLLLTIVSILQNQIDSTQEQYLETIIENQTEIIDTLQQQLDATMKTVDSLSIILSEIETNAEKSQENLQRSSEHPVSDDSDSQLTDSVLPESQLESPISYGEPGVPDMH